MVLRRWLLRLSPRDSPRDSARELSRLPIPFRFMALNSAMVSEGSLRGAPCRSEQELLSPPKGILLASRDGLRRGGSGGEGDARNSFASLAISSGELTPTRGLSKDHCRAGDTRPALRDGARLKAPPTVPGGGDHAPDTMAVGMSAQKLSP